MILICGCANGFSIVFAKDREHDKNNFAAATDTFYVSPAGNNITGTGAKNNPWRSLTFALSKSSADSLNPKVIKLANGVYSTAVTNESFPITLKSWIALAGSDSLNTIIDANRAGRVLVGLNAANVLIQRLTIRNGFASADTGDASRGGALMLRNCRQIVLRSCVLRSNEAKTQGGGVFLGSGSGLSLENNFIESNNAGDGAGIYCSRTKSAKCLANVIQKNTAKNSGGGVYIDRASPILQRNRVRWNNANAAITRNAGGVVVRSGNPIIGGALETGNDIHDNIGGSSASQLYVNDNTSPVNARYNYWGAIPTSKTVAPASFVDFTNYRTLAINIPLGSVDFYVNPNASDRNNGTKNASWRTLSYAFTQIFATDLDSLTIHLAPGTYSAMANGEQFPVYAKNHITVLGALTNQSPTTVISGEGVTSRELLRFEEVSKFRLANIAFRNYKTNLKIGAVLARNSDDLMIENCLFEDNQSQRGPALTLIQIKSSEIRNNIFRRNHSASSGGALALLDDASTLTGNIFIDNSAATGGGAAHCDSASETRFIKNEFQNNSAGFGGALYVTLSTGRIFNNRFLANRATQSGGGAIALDGASLPQIGTRDSQANDIYLNTAAQGGSQIQRLELGVKVDARYNYWGQIPDSTALSPFGQFAAENFRQVSARLPFDTKAIYISPQGNDAATGLSRSQALRTIGEALRLVFGIAQNPITVHLLPGKFAKATNGEAFPIPLESYVVLRGASRDSTTVDAESRSQVFVGHDVVGSVIANLKIAGGKSASSGGAILLRDGKAARARNAVAATIENCAIQTNAAAHGGALAAVRNYKTIMRNCVILNNTAQQHGGAVLALGDSVEIKDSELYSNIAQKDGGGVHVDSAAVLTLINNRIHDNTAAQGGGIAVTNGVSRIWRNFIIDNFAQNGPGGGIYLSANGKAVIGGANGEGNDIYGNRASSAGRELGSAARSDKIEARFNFFGGKPEANLVGNLAMLDVSSYRKVTIIAPEKSREFFVSPKGHDNNAGASKNAPWKTLAAALRRFFSEPGDSAKLHLQSGIYSAKTNGERFPLIVPNRVTFLGQHPDSVVLDGENKSRLLVISNAAQVYLRNLSISNGNAVADPIFKNAGGVSIRKSKNIQFEQVVFRGNKTEQAGGAIAADSSDKVNWLGCRFLENQGLGGGVFLQRTSGEIRGCEFRQNKSLTNGAAIYLSSASPKLTNNIIVGNVSNAADLGGAIFCVGNSSPVIGGAAGQGNDIYNNTGGVRGKALARQENTPVVNATFNYFGNGNLNETVAFPLKSFDLSFSRNVPIAANGKPVITQLTPSTAQPLRAGRLDTVRFKVSAYDPDNDLLIFTWTINEATAPAGFGANFNFYPFFVGLGEHHIRLVVSDQTDTVTVNWKVLISTTSVNEQKEILPTTFALQQNFPNPLRNAEALTVIPFQIPEATEVVLSIYDLLGRRVRLLERAQRAAGFYQALWDGRDQTGSRVESGVYFIRMQAGEFTAMRKMVVTR
jgi:predicted outer membrane repeat protein